MELYAYRCKNCGKLHHPARLVCDACGGREFEPEPLTGSAKLLSWTHLNNLPSGIDAPYLEFGILEFENGVRVSGRLETKNPPAIGQILRADVGVVRVVDGEEKPGFIFRD